MTHDLRASSESPPLRLSNETMISVSALWGGGSAGRGPFRILSYGS
jgi:hypothetical protein